MITGVLDPGEASGVPVISSALKKESEAGVDVIIDCPPGSACPVVESIKEADYCLLVAEPTAFGFHNFCMVHELASLLHKPCGVIINKEEEDMSLWRNTADRKIFRCCCVFPTGRKLPKLYQRENCLWKNCLSIWMNLRNYQTV